MTLTTSFAGLHARLSYADLGPNAIRAAKERCIDYLGALAGGINGSVVEPVRAATLQACALSESTVLATHERASQAQAALLNGIAGHTLELDDGERRAYGHPAVVAFSAAFPVAEALRSSGKSFLAAIAAGYEAYLRLGSSVNPGTVQRGFHTTGVVGALEAAVTAAKLYAATDKVMTDALSIACLCSSGLTYTFRKANALKAFNAGRAAYNGVIGAQMAVMGIEGADDFLEGKGGFFQAYSGLEPSEEKLLAPLASPFAVEGSYIKFYPSCRYTHAPIDAALALRSQCNIEDVEKIVITTYPTAILLTARTEMPEDAGSARFNIGFAVAVAFVKGHVGLGDLDPKTAEDARVGEIFSKISYVEDASWDCPERNVRGAAMDIVLKGGRTLRTEIPLPVGEPENPAPAEKYREKFLDLSAGVWSRKRQEEILETVGVLEELDDITRLTRLLCADV